MSGLIGKKIGMTSLYDEGGKNLACTVIEAGPCVVTQIKNNEKELVVSYEKNIINIQEIIDVIKSQKIDIFDVQSRDPDLEDVFIKLIKIL